MDQKLHYVSRCLLQVGLQQLERLNEREQLQIEFEAGEIGPDEYTVTIRKTKKEKNKAVVPTGVAMLKGMTPGEASKIKEVKPKVKDHVHSHKDTKVPKNDKEFQAQNVLKYPTFWLILFLWLILYVSFCILSAGQIPQEKAEGQVLLVEFNNFHT